MWADEVGLLRIAFGYALRSKNFLFEVSGTVVKILEPREASFDVGLRLLA
jgi:hypothetical protein